ncbi:MAG: TonB-dependent receptor domain-containing protein [Caulobacterales bacterium]|uniref:TonB-dependent receptor domain-containing protein n=1 Tax=Glycocaulis sp. TaxID=1969725 RepID=UPI003FA12389
MKPLYLFSAALLTSTALLAPSALARQAEEAPAASEPVETISVRGQFIPEPQRRTAQVASFVSAEDLERSGDANAAVALTRLSGLSIVGGRFAYVRGLGDRYAAALLNGSPLPSPEPLRRIVPLDLFPSEILDGVDVQKTYSANFGGEFGGGLITLRTLRRPVDPFFNVSASVGYNTVATGENAIIHRGSDTDWDWTGYDDSTRDIPIPLADVLANGRNLNDLSAAELELVSESVVIPNLLVIQSQDLHPDYSVSANGGFAFNLGEIEMGLVGAVGFDAGWSLQNAQRQRVRGDVLGTDLTTQLSSYDAVTNSLVSLSAEQGDHQLGATLFYVHSARKDTQLTRGEDFNAQGGRPIYRESTGWFERDLAMFQLTGEHMFGNLEARWRGSIAQATRQTPFLQELTRLEQANGDIAFTSAARYEIQFTDLTDDLTNFGGELLYTFNLPGSRELVMMAGADTTRTEREYTTLFFRMAGGNSLPADVQIARPDFLFSPDNIGPSRFQLTEVQNTQSNYVGELDVDAFFVQADLDVTSFIRATLGVRYEDAVQSVQTFSRFGQLGRGATLDNDYVLPAATVTWNFADDLQLRLGFSQTIARPQFREFANSGFFDPESQRSFRGFDGLVDSELNNYDARLEYYLGRDQFITAAIFYKEITNPIEEVQFETASFVSETTFLNSPKAELQGVELEYRQYFQFPLDIGWFRERDWRFAVNYTYTQSEIVAPAGTQVLDPISGTLRDASFFNLDGSNLQGTPENIVNAQIGWEGDNDQFTLLMNWVDERIVQRGFNSPSGVLPDVIDEPGVQLDFQYRRRFAAMGREFSLGFAGRNLLDEDYREYQRNETIGETEFNTYERGRTFSLSLSTSF